eukprot:2893584-Rhodomonas_salina.1
MDGQVLTRSVMGGAGGGDLAPEGRERAAGADGEADGGHRDGAVQEPGGGHRRRHHPGHGAGGARDAGQAAAGSGAQVGAHHRRLLAGQPLQHRQRAHRNPARRSCRRLRSGAVSPGAGHEH